MKLTVLALAASLVATPALACIPTVTPTGHSLIINTAGAISEFFYADLRRGSDELRGIQLQNAIQAQQDFRLVRLEIISDDPDRNSDPDSSSLYWSDADGNPVEPAGNIFDATHLTHRCVIVTLLGWDGTDFRFMFSRP